MAENIVDLKELRKEYFELVAVDSVSLSIPAGEIFGLIGPNGAGKTTTLRMLATTLEPTSGRVMFDGRDIWENPVEVRRNIGFMPDFFQMYRQLKVRELLTYFGIAHGMEGDALADRVREVIGLVGLADKTDEFCRGLSRGMVQKLGLARAILHRPKLLLLDEPASGLDPVARQTLFDALRALNAEGATILISSHILGELTNLCTSVGIMEKGRFLESGPTRAIIKKILPKNRLSLRVLPGSENETLALLEADSKVSEIERQDVVLSFNFAGSDEDLAELHATLVNKGVKVVLLSEAENNLHEAYIAIAEREENAATE